MKQGIEWQVSSLGLSKRLRELGVPQSSYFWWGNNGTPDSENWVGDNQSDPRNICAAYTVAELGEIFKRIGAASEDHIKYYITEKCDKTTSYIDLLSADFWAKMLIYLIEKGLVDVKLLGNKEI